MLEKLDRILLTGMEFWGQHGVFASEQELPWKLTVDLEIGTDLRPAGETDQLEQSIDYVKLHEIARTVIEEGRQQLLEAMAEEIAKRILAEPRIEQVLVRLGKPQVPVRQFSGSVAVEIRRGRGSWR